MVTNIVLHPDTLVATVTNNSTSKSIVEYRENIIIEYRESDIDSFKSLKVLNSNREVILTIEVDNLGNYTTDPTTSVNGLTNIVDCYNELIDWKIFYPNPCSTSEPSDGDKGDIVVSNFGTTWKFKNADKGDIVISGNGSTMTVDNGVINLAKLGGDITAAGKALLDDIDSAAQRVTLGLGNVDNTSDLNKPISTLTQTALNAKQATLVSGTNIKTINNQSLLGPGNITISAPPAPPADLTYTASPTNGIVESSSGTDATIPLVDGTNAGLMSPANFTKLSGIGAGLPTGGTTGQVLTKVDATNYSATWQDVAASYTSVVKHTVKNNGAAVINKGTPVYSTGSDGTNILVAKASNASESTSSKTMGLTQTQLTTSGSNQTGFVITEGLLGGLDTQGTTAGDPVWLGVNGGLIYGLTNKPYAPAHLVFLGIVTKVSAGNGEIFVKVQNGFELQEIHNVDLVTTTPVNGHILGYDGTLWVNKTIATWLGFTPENVANKSDSYTVSSSTTYATTKALVDGLATKENTLGFTPENVANKQTDLTASSTKYPTVNAVNTGLSTKEPTITAGTTSQYWRGDKSWQTLDKSAVGLNNVDNTSDANKPVSTATQSALNLKENTITAGTTSQYYRGDKTFQTLDKAAVGLSNVDNTSDATKNSASVTLTNKTISGANNTISNIAQTSITNLTTDLASKVNKSGDTMTGALVLSGSPTNALHAVTKDYVDTLINGIDWKQAVNAATISALPSYNVTGSGQILTGTINGAIPSATTDGVALTINQRVLVKNETSTNTPNNGIYTVTQVGNGSLPFILTRTSDANTPTLLAEATISVAGGSTLSNTQWHCNPASTPITIGSTNITFAQIGSGVYTAGSGLSLSSNAFSISSNGVTDAMIQSSSNWNTAYTNRITSLTTTGTSGAATLTGNTLNIPQYTTPTNLSLDDITASGTINILNDNGSGVSIPLADSVGSGIISASNYDKLTALSTSRQIPAGGTTGQVLGKTTNSDYAIGWLDNVVDGSVTFAKMANISNNTLIGRFTAGTGSPESVGIGSGLSNTGTTLYNTLAVGLGSNQTVIGGLNASGTLTLSSTSNATKGKILFGNSAYDEANQRLGIGTQSPTSAVHFALPTNLSGTQNAMYLSSAFDATATGTKSFIQYDLTTAGSNGNTYGLVLNLLPGLTGTSSTQGIRIINTTTTSPTFDPFVGTGNAGAVVASTGAGGGANYGMSTTASNSLFNIGNRARATGGTIANSTNVGVLGIGNVGTSTGTVYQIGGYFTLETVTPTLTFSAALACDNGTATNDIFVARDNGTAVFTIADGGAVNSTGNITVPDSAYGASWNGDNTVPTKNAIYDKIETLGGGGGSYTFSTGLTNTAGTVTSNLSTGIAGGQSVIGGTAASNNLTLSSTSNATKGKILFGTSAYDEANNRLGIIQQSPTSRLHINANQNSVTQNDSNGILLANSTAATNGTQSISPPLVIQGNGYQTGTNGSQDVRFRMDVLPVQGSGANPTGQFRLSSSINGGAYSNILTYNSTGILECYAVSGSQMILAQSQLVSSGLNPTFFAASTFSYSTRNSGGTTVTPRIFLGDSTGTSSGAKTYGIDPTYGIVFIGGNASGNRISRASIDVEMTTNTAGSEDGTIVFRTQAAGANMATRVTITSDRVTSNIGINSNIQLIQSSSSVNSLSYNTTTGGTSVTPSVIAATNSSTAGDRGISLDRTNGLVFMQVPTGALFRRTSYAAINGVSTSNTASSESGALSFLTQNAGAVMSEKLRISATGDFTFFDGGNFIIGTTTGTKIGTATSQKLAFWNATPIVQPTTAVGAATFVGGAGTTITSTDTFDGYTLQQIVKALRNIGLLA